MSRTKTTSRDVWCDHCDYRYTTKVSTADGVAVCPNCGKPTLLVTCGVCENHCELSHINFEKGNWICPQCKEYREFSAETLTDYLAAQIAIDPTEKVRRRWRPSFKVGCIALIFLYLFSAFLLISCNQLFSRTPSELLTLPNVPTSTSVVMQTPIAPSYSELSQQVDIDLSPYLRLAYLTNGDAINLFDTVAQTHRALERPAACRGEIKAVAWPSDPDAPFMACSEANITLFFSLELDGSVASTQLTNKPYQSLALSPTQRQVAYTLESERGLMLHDLADGTDEQLNKMVSTSPTWSPDGTRIAFVGGYSQLDNIYLFTPETVDLQSITTNSARVERQPAWSPTRDAIVFIANYSSFWNLYRYDFATATVTRLTDLSLGELRNPTWTPDGKYVLFSADFDGDFDLYVIDPATTDNVPLRLFNTSTDETHAVFAP